MTVDSEFDSIRPYDDSEVPAAAQRLAESKDFLALFTYLVKQDVSIITKALQNIRSRKDFQEILFGPAIRTLMENTTDGVTVEGLELVDPNTSYTFMSNHRDIAEGTRRQIHPARHRQQSAHQPMGDRFRQTQLLLCHRTQHHREGNAEQLATAFTIHPEHHTGK